MRSTELKLVTVTALGAMALAACSSGPAASSHRPPQIQENGSRAHHFTSVKQLAAKSNAIAIVTPTRTSFTRPMPRSSAPAGSAGTPYVRMKVVKVVSGSVSGQYIDVVSPGTDTQTHKSAIAGTGPFMVFLAPAMYNRDSAAGGYAIVGGPAGLYAAPKATGNTFAKVDRESPSLPKTLTALTGNLPTVSKTEKQLLHEGP